MIQKNYQGDYRAVLSTDSGGKTVEKYIYKGDWFVLEPEAQWKKSRMPAAASAAVLAAVYFLTGFTGGESGRLWYVVLPYMLGMLPMAFLLTGAWRVLRVPWKMKREEKDRSWLRLRNMTVLLAACSGMALIGQAIFLVFAKDLPATEWAFFLLLAVVLSGSCIYIHWIVKKCKKIAKIPADSGSA